MSGPPTPPPSSALELEDAARIVQIPPEIAPEATTAVVPPPPVDQPIQPPEEPIAQPAVIQDEIPTLETSPYKPIFDVLVDLAAHDKFEELTQIAEVGDLNVRRLAISTLPITNSSALR